MNFISRAPHRVRHENGLRLARVVFVEPVSPRMRRITFHAPEFADFSSAAADDHVKLFFAAPGVRLVLPEIGSDGVRFPEGTPKPIARDYTPRRFDLQAREITIEFVLHDHGVASDWAKRARPGDVIGIGGPRGSLVIPDDYDAYLLMGDETALPAIARRLEELPPGAHAIAIIEIADKHEERQLATAANAEITWLHRDSLQPGKSGLLEAALEKLRLPSGDIHAWIGCEIETARRLRTHLTETRGIDRAQVKAAGYWKIGEAGAHGKVE